MRYSTRPEWTRLWHRHTRYSTIPKRRHATSFGRIGRQGDDTPSGLLTVKRTAVPEQVPMTSNHSVFNCYLARIQELTHQAGSFNGNEQAAAFKHPLEALDAVCSTSVQQCERSRLGGTVEWTSSTRCLTKPPVDQARNLAPRASLSSCSNCTSHTRPIT